VTTATIDAVFRALGDPTRREIIEWMATGETPTATEVAERFPMTRQGVSRHLGVLARSGLVTGEKRGREVRYSLDPASLHDAETWLTERTRSWDRALQRLETYLEEESF
jgi:DNA-binding transcriptional ArsR family regulator